MKSVSLSSSSCLGEQRRRKDTNEGEAAAAAATEFFSVFQMTEAGSCESRDKKEAGP